MGKLPWQTMQQIQKDVKETAKKAPPSKKTEAVSKEIKRKKARRSSATVGAKIATTPKTSGSIPLETGAVKLVTSEPSSPPPTPEIVQKDVTVKPSQWIDITWEKPGGEQVVVQTRADRLSSLQTRIQDDYGGRIIRARVVSSGDVFFEAPTRSKWEATMRDYYKREYQETGYIPLDVQKDISKKIPESVLGAGSIPSQKFIQESYAVGLGIKSETEAGRAIEKSVIKHADITWAEKYITEWDVPTTEKVEKLPWNKVKEIEPAAFIEKTPQGFTVSYDPYKWQQIETARAKQEGDYGYLFGKWYSETFSPARTEYGIRSLFQSPGPRQDESFNQYMKRYSSFETSQTSLLAGGHYDWFKKYRSGDYGGIAIETVQSPLVMPFVTHGALKVGGYAVRGIARGGKYIVSSTPKVYGKISGMVPKTKLVKIPATSKSAELYWGSLEGTRVLDVPPSLRGELWGSVVTKGGKPIAMFLHPGLPRTHLGSFVKSVKEFGRSFISRSPDAIFNYPTRGEVFAHELTHWYNPKFSETFVRQITPKIGYLYTGQEIPTIGGRIFGGIGSIGRTSFWHNIYGWSTGSMIRVKSIPLAYTTYGKNLGEGFRGRVEHYRGFMPKTKWVPKKLVSRYRGIGEAGVRYTDMGAESTAIFETYTKPKGLLWKKISRQIVSYEETEPFIFEKIPTTTTMYKAPGFVGRYSTPGITIPSVSEQTPWSKVVGEYMTTQFKPPASVQGVQRFWMSPEKAWHLKVMGKKLSVKQPSIITSKEASLSLVKPIPTIKPSLGFKGSLPGYVTSQEIFVPTKAFIPSVTVTSLTSTGIIAGSAGLSIVRPDITNIQRLSVKPMKTPTISSAYLYGVEMEQAQITGLGTLQSSITSQVQLQKQISAKASATKLITQPSYPSTKITTSGTAPSPPRIPIRIVVPPPVVIPELFEGKTKKKKPKFYEPYGKGYRYRKWKTPKMEDLLKIK